jgi:hypothetical protein
MLLGAGVEVLGEFSSVLLKKLVTYHFQFGQNCRHSVLSHRDPKQSLLLRCGTPQVHKYVSPRE